MRRRGIAPVGSWLAFVLVCVWLVMRADFSADLSAFLPRNPSPEQQLLVDQLKSGIASRLVLIAIDGGDAGARAQASMALAGSLRHDPRFLHVANGEVNGLERERQILFDNRYLLSPAVRPERFTVAGLRDAVQESIDQIASSTGLLTKSWLTRDPTGEFIQVLDQAGAVESQPRMADGVWVSRDGGSAVLLARTRAGGAATDEQEHAVAAIRAAFQAHAPSGLRLSMTGPGPFSVAARATIKNEVSKLSGVSSLIIAGVLLIVYRSALALTIGLLPVVTSALAGVAAVSLCFGTVHGITLGFGTALVGEAVDYPIYLLLQSENARDPSDRPHARWITAAWPTIRIGVLTSMFGFAPLLYSDFPGLAQLGLYSIVGLFTAAAVTRFVLPHLIPTGLRLRDLAVFGSRLLRLQRAASHLRWPLVGGFVVACVVIATHRDRLWNRELAALSPVPAAEQAMDMRLRADLGAPDVRYLVVATAATVEDALAASERIGKQLQKLQDDGVIARYMSPAMYLPSVAIQKQRIASLPAAPELRRRFLAAITDLPVRANRFDAFLTDVEATRGRSPLRRADLEGTALAEGVDSLLVQISGQWTALLPLQAPDRPDHAIDAARVRSAIAATGLSGIHFVDLKHEADTLYEGYLRAVILLSLAGLGAIIGFLFLVTGSALRVSRILAPLCIAVAVVIAGFVLRGQELTLLHLVGMLLIFAVGSNYALFFDKGGMEGGLAPRTLASLVVAATTTVAGFGLLGFSTVPVLNAIGATVAPGAVLALLFSAILAPRP